ncbi:octopamine receptor 1-like [Acanthaster planci]|uniref:Octopamine receptor 1-like n=1 Tax=Acanthaster planci TaxID=133434 RepID=A0A8B7YPW8_ACAPL|nr:octopamine receptor 1-like [Acanthaster planci]XP_022095323.1 octopamine receptor 1-like [Acanthaster planci]XP_022095325.1 octopamine receptor 1-like [Acanthaster planci]
MENTTAAMEDTLYTSTKSSITEGPSEDELSPSAKFGVAVYCIIGSFGLVGNLVACIVFNTIKSKKNQVSLLIFTQALADLVSSIVIIIFGITRVYRHRLPTTGGTGEWLCRFWWTRFVIFYFFAISTFNLTLISLERYIAVIHPLTYAKRFTRRNTKIFVVIVWLFCPVMQWGQPLWGYTVVNGTCVTIKSWDDFGQAFFGVLLFLWELITPICVMGVCFVSIVITLRKKELACRTPTVKVKPERSGSVFKPIKKHVRRDITMTLLILFILFVICWTPNQTTFVQFNLGGPLDFNGGWYHFTVILGFANCCVNPFVYAFRLRQFRVRVLLMLQCRCKAFDRADESDNELFRDPASTSNKWSSRREKLGKIFKLTRQDNASLSRTPENTASPEGSPFPSKKSTLKKTDSTNELK